MKMTTVTVRTTPFTQWLAGRGHSLERRLAPHVEPAWSETVILELRLRGVDGEHIGAVLAEVESHCVESGRSAREAFGDPAAYARSLDLPAEPTPAAGELVASALPTLVQVIGMLTVLWGFTAWRAGGDLEITVGRLVALGLLLAVVAAALRWIDRVLALIVRHPVMAWLALMAVTAASVAPLLMPEVVLASLPATTTLVLGAVVLAVGTGWTALHHGLRGADDPVVTPLGPDLDSRPRRRWLALALVTGIIPLFTALALAVTWRLTGLTG